ncbi:DUF2147 domain-containing protein [Mucilaginibacter sp. RCC_168]|uniref:DUF2147 domain-containing protein n=1 Tax=Mucilaginibacter sp. RCC_168 TaxID=3239221 RepID=UPI003524A87F
MFSKSILKSALSTLHVICFTTIIAAGQSVSPQERICGKWESAQKNLRIQVLLQNNQFKAKIIWFSDTEGKPIDYWTDVHNPDPALRHRKLLGMSILSGLVYKPSSNSWENGIVYDSRHGRYWNASAFIGKKGLLHVRGYWHFKWIGKTMTFHRIP